MRLIDVAIGKLLGCTSGVDEGVEVVIDYLEPTEAERWADTVKELFDRGLLIKAIAAELGISRNLASAGLEVWYERRGLVSPDGRSRRKALEKKQLKPPQFQAIADEAKQLYDTDLEMSEIAQRLDCDRNTLTAAIAYWHTSKGLPKPDGRSRRKRLPRAGRRG